MDAASLIFKYLARRLNNQNNARRLGYYQILSSVRVGSQYYDRMLWPAGQGTYRKAVHGPLKTS